MPYANKHGAPVPNDLCVLCQASEVEVSPAEHLSHVDYIASVGKTAGWGSSINVRDLVVGYANSRNPQS